MHTFSETGAGVPAFLAKLWRLVEDSETNDLISWSTDGRSFIIQNQAQFAKELLPLNYKHNNMASFIRQLNMYGFHKITSIDNGGLRFDKDEMEFTHPCFQKDHPYLLEHIKRKIATSKQQQLQQAQQQQHQQLQDDKSAMKLEAVSRVLSEVKNMRGRQDSLDSRFQTMKQENEALWREIAILRQKHHKQQQIVNKLIHFLVTIVQPSRGGLGTMGNGNNKRRFQLMINEAPQQAKVKKQHDFTESATIEELGEALEEVAYANQQDLLSEQDKSKKVKVIPVMSGQIVVPTSSSVGHTASAGTGKGSSSASGTNSSAIVRTVNGSSIVKENIAPSGVKKAKRNSEIPEISSPMSQPGRSPYRTATPSLSAGSPTGSVASSTSGGAVYGGHNGGEDGDLNEEVFSPHGLTAKQPRGNRSNGARSHQSGTNKRPLNLIELIESTVNGADDYEEEDTYGDEDVDQHAAYLVDHVDEVANPELGALYQDNDGENDMMLNTPMVLREMEKQEQLKRQQQQHSAGKGGESLLKGVTMATRSGRPQRSVVGQKSLLTAGTAAPAVASMKAGRTGPRSTTAPVAISKGVKRISVGGSGKKQSQAADSDLPQHPIGVAPAGPSNYSGKGQGSSTNSPSPPLVAAAGGPSFGSGDAFVPTPADVVPGDIFEDSSDQTMGSGVAVKDASSNGKPSPMLGSFSLVDGGYYNPNVNVNEVKASLQRQQLQGQQQGGMQQVPIAIGDVLDNGETHDDEFDENSLDSNLMLNQATGNQQQQDLQQQQQQLQLQMQPQQQQQDQQLSKFVSNDADMSRLNTVAEYGQHIDTVQTDLDSLRELLKGDNYQMDANALLGTANSTTPPYGRVYFPSCPFDQDTLNKLFNNNNDDLLNYDFPMNLPDLMTDEQQQQQQQLQQQQQGSNEKSTVSDSSPTPGGQIMAYRKGNSNGNLYGNNNGAIGLNGLAHNSVTNDASGLLGGNNLIGTDGTIVSGDYIDLNELLNMDPNAGAYYGDENSLVA